ncbi:MAG TPA: EscU/YscU/HrcU family type III secretion system export apparatus switch protein [Spirochaetia bacterium]|nr:EscU/YscU/HrcU family type III secretion system export apparatus switch protein [Spirochaetia bacterium]
MTVQPDTAVALHYNEDLPAPIVVASGRGPIADVITRIARESGVPVVADPALAADLIELDVNTLIPESLYEVIASLLVFVRGLQPESPPAVAPA